MHTEVLENFDKLWIPITSLIIFLVCFIVFFYWTMKKDNKSFYEQSSYMPLTDGVEHERK